LKFQFNSNSGSAEGALACGKDFVRTKCNEDKTRMMETEGLGYRLYALVRVKGTRAFPCKGGTASRWERSVARVTLVE